MLDTPIQNLLHTMMALIALFIIAFALDYPEQRRKKRKERCASGNHKLSIWRFDFDIGYNDKDVWKRHCENCNYKEWTISRLDPLDDWPLQTFKKKPGT